MPQGANPSNTLTALVSEIGDIKVQDRRHAGLMGWDVSASLPVQQRDTPRPHEKGVKPGGDLTCMRWIELGLIHNFKQSRTGRYCDPLRKHDTAQISDADTKT